MNKISEVQKKALEKIRNIYKKWFIHEPLMYAVMVYHKLVPNEDIRSIRVNSGELEFNSRFIVGMMDYKLNEVLMFETYRILLKHPYQRAKANKMINYFSSSITINGVFEHTLDVVSLEDLGIDSKGHENNFHEYYYDLIIRNGKGITDELAGMPQCGKHEADKAEDSTQSSSEDGDDFSEPVDAAESFGSSNPSDYEGNPETEFNAEIDSYLRNVKTALENTEEWRYQEDHVENINRCIEDAKKCKLWGSISGGFQTAILASLKPEVDYRSILKKFKADLMGFDHNIPTTRKFNRRLGFPYLGKTTEPTTKIGFCLDVSGSISDEGLNKGFSLVNRLFSYEIREVELIQFDVSVKRDQICKLKRAKLKNMATGRDGTDLRDLIDYIKERKDMENFLIFTDGYFDHDLKLPGNKNVCFLLETKECYDDFIHSNLASNSSYVAYVKPTL